LTDGPVLAGLSISDAPQRWAALGFRVSERGRAGAGGVEITLGIAPPGHGIVGWALHSVPEEFDFAGVPTQIASPPKPVWGDLMGHRNRVIGVDHVVVVTPDFDGLAAAWQFKRVGERDGRRQGFRRLGRPILEVVEAPDAPATRFWGVTFITDDLDELAAENRFVGEPRPAIQPGRRIATVSRDAGLSTRLAFMDPEPDPPQR
jgi:hypothetical protein